MGATDSKLVFKKGIFRLFEERNIPSTDNDYWSMFWTLPGSIRDVHNLLDPADIIKIRDNAIENLETLFDILIDHLDETIHSKTHLNSLEILNCCRIITRIIPFIYETNCIEGYFWMPKHDSVLRGEQLISLAIEALFLSGFTIPQLRVDLKINYVIWETGVASSTPIGSSRENDWNRIEILRLIITLLSKPLYQKDQNRWLDYMVTGLDKKVTLAFLCSMLNTCCKFNPMSWSASSSTGDQLVAYCLHVLLILGNNPSIHHKHTESMGKNAFRHYLSRLHRAQDFQFLMDGIHRTLSSPMQTLNAPSNSSKYYVEMMMLCWKLLEINHRFTNYIMETERGLDLMVMLLFHADENKFNPQGSARVCLYTLQTLSSNKKFSAKLNKPFKGHVCLPVHVRIPNFQGSYADYLILSIYSLIVSSRGSLTSYYSTLMKIIANVSPDLKNLSKLTSSKLVSLFGALSSPSFLLADKDNHQSVVLLLEAINNILDHQFEYNPNLIYAIVQRHQKFEKLAEFNLQDAFAEIDRMKQDSGIDLRMPRMALHRNPSTSSNVSIGNQTVPGSEFLPTDEWLYQWHSKLPLETITSLIEELLPKLGAPNMTYYQITSVLKNVPALPSPHPVTDYEFQWTEVLLDWYQGVLWSQVLGSVKHNPWLNTNINID